MKSSGYSPKQFAQKRLVITEAEIIVAGKISYLDMRTFRLDPKT